MDKNQEQEKNRLMPVSVFIVAGPAGGCDFFDKHITIN